jgi:hypothetical protein
MYVYVCAYIYIYVYVCVCVLTCGIVSHIYTHASLQLHALASGGADLSTAKEEIKSLLSGDTEKKKEEDAKV